MFAFEKLIHSKSSLHDIVAVIESRAKDYNGDYVPYHSVNDLLNIFAYKYRGPYSDFKIIFDTFTSYIDVTKWAEILTERAMFTESEIVDIIKFDLDDVLLLYRVPEYFYRIPERFNIFILVEKAIESYPYTFEPFTLQDFLWKKSYISAPIALNLLIWSGSNTKIINMLKQYCISKMFTPTLTNRCMKIVARNYSDSTILPSSFVNDYKMYRQILDQADFPLNKGELQSLIDTFWNTMKECAN